MRKPLFFCLPLVMYLFGVANAFAQHTYMRIQQNGSSEMAVACVPAANNRVWLFEEIDLHNEHKVRLQLVDSTGLVVMDKYLLIQQVFGVAAARDGSVIVVGRTEQAAASVVVSLKFDKYGKVKWYKSFGAATENTHIKVVPAADGGFLMVQNEPFDLSTDKSFIHWKPFYDAAKWNHTDAIPHITKMDAAGNQQWKRRYTEFPGGTFNEIQPTSDAGYILTGGQFYQDRYRRNAFVAKLNADGTISWHRTYTKGERYIGISITPSPDGGYVMGAILGENNSLHINKLSPEGEQKWDKLLPLHGSNQAKVRITAARQIWCMGSTELRNIDTETPNSSLLYLASLSLETGNVQWEHTFGEIKHTNIPLEMLPMSDSGAVMAATAGRIIQRKFQPIASILLKADAAGHVGSAFEHTEDELHSTPQITAAARKITTSNTRDIAAATNTRGMDDGTMRRATIPTPAPRAVTPTPLDEHPNRIPVSHPAYGKIKNYLTENVYQCKDTRPESSGTGYSVACSLGNDIVAVSVIFDNQGEWVSTKTTAANIASEYLDAKDIIALIRAKCYCTVGLRQEITGAYKIEYNKDGTKTIYAPTAQGLIKFNAEGRVI